MYLRDVHVIQDQHRKALWASSEEVMDLVSALPANILRLSTGEEEDMGVTRIKWTKKSNPTQINNLSILSRISCPHCYFLRLKYYMFTIQIRAIHNV